MKKITLLIFLTFAFFNFTYAQNYWSWAQTVYASSNSIVKYHERRDSYGNSRIYNNGSIYPYKYNNIDSNKLKSVVNTVSPHKERLAKIEKDRIDRQNKDQEIRLKKIEEKVFIQKVRDQAKAHWK